MVADELSFWHGEAAAASGGETFVVNAPVWLFAGEVVGVGEDEYGSVVLQFVLDAPTEVSGSSSEYFSFSVGGVFFGEGFVGTCPWLPSLDFPPCFTKEALILKVFFKHPDSNSSGSARGDGGIEVFKLFFKRL